MSNLHWDDRADHPFAIKHGNGRRRHRVAVTRESIRILCHHAHVGLIVSIDDFVDAALRDGDIVSSSEYSTSLALQDGSSSPRGWIAFNGNAVIVKDPNSRRKREVGYELLQSIADKYGKRPGRAI